MWGYNGPAVEPPVVGTSGFAGVQNSEKKDDESEEMEVDGLVNLPEGSDQEFEANAKGTPVEDFGMDDGEEWGGIKKHRTLKKPKKERRWRKEWGVDPKRLKKRRQ